MSGLSEDTRALIDAAREGDDPSEGDRARVRAAIARRIALGAAAGAAVATASHVAGGATSAAVGAGTATAATAGTVATTSIAAGGLGGGTAAALVTSLGAKILVSVAIVGAVSAGTATYVKHEAAKRAVPTVSAAAPVTPSRNIATASPASVPAIAAPVVIAPPPPPPAAPEPVATTTPSPAPVAAPTPSPAAAPTAPPLDAEVALLQEAHAALRAVADHGRRFPSGQLGEEFEGARVFALCELGRVDEARDVASRFLREHPRSPLAPRVANACESNAPSTF
jgi:hypothetical protein